MRTVLFTLMAAVLATQVAGVHSEYSLITHEHGRTAGLVIDAELLVGTLAVLVPGVEMIVRDSVLSAVPTLSRDETLVTMRREIAPDQFYKSTTQTRARPAPPRPVIVIEPDGSRVCTRMVDKPAVLRWRSARRAKSM